MRYRFHSKELERLYIEKKGARRYSKGVVKAFFEVMSMIAAVPSERALRSIRGLRFEQLSGKRADQFSVRLNQQFRLTFVINQGQDGNELYILAIEDYH